MSGSKVAVAIISITIAILAIVVSQTHVARITTLYFGLGRKVEPLSAFPYACKRVKEPALDGCSSMWLSEATRQLFFACSDPGANIKALDIDLLKLRTVKTATSSNLTSITGHDDLGGDVRLWAVAAPKTAGEGATVELFRAGHGDAGALEHEWTFDRPQIATPRKVTPKLEGEKPDFWFTNERGQHTNGTNHHLSPFLSTGDVSMCRKKACWPVFSDLSSPSGIVRGHDGLHYVGSSSIGGIGTFEHVFRQGFKKLDQIDTEHAIEDLTVDSSGVIYAAAAPNAVLKITKLENGYTVEKVLEDSSVGVLPSRIRTVAHDPKSALLFIGGYDSMGYDSTLAVCQPKGV